jgi:hypothetical protein
MTPHQAADKTSRAGLERQLWQGWIEFEIDQTGWELGRGYQVIVISDAELDPFEQAPSPARRGPGGLAAEAAAFALAAPQVESSAPPAPRLTGNLAEDVHNICGLTWEQIGQIFKISERAAAGWRMQGVPNHRQELMEALRAIGLTLVGGLGPVGVAQWLTAGEPSRVQRLRAGEIEPVAAEARSYLDGPAT